MWWAGSKWELCYVGSPQVSQRRFTITITSSLFTIVSQWLHFLEGLRPSHLYFNMSKHAQQIYINLTNKVNYLTLTISTLHAPWFLLVTNHLRRQICQKKKYGNPKIYPCIYWQRSQIKPNIGSIFFFFHFQFSYLMM